MIAFTFPFLSQLLAGAKSKMSVPHKRAKEKLYVVVCNNDYHINNILDENEPCPIQEIVQDAYSVLGKERPYGVLTRHGEHFVMELRYRKPQTRQVQLR